MGLWLKLAVRNALRNIRRSGLTALTVVVGTSLFTISVAWINGMFGGIINQYTAASGHIRLVDADFAAKEELHPLYDNIEDTAPLLAALRAVPGVVAAEPRIMTGATLTKTEEIGEDFALVVGATESYYRDRLHGPDTIQEGTWLTGKPGEVVLGRVVARQAQLRVGDEVLLLGQTQYGSMAPVTAKVVGIATGDGALEQQAFLPLSELQWMVDLPDGALEVLVYTEGRDAETVAPVAAAIAGLEEAKGLAVLSWYTQDPWAGLLGILDGVQWFIQMLIVFIAALAIFNTMTMSVLERSGEIGVMRAMGMSGAGAVGLFVLEAVAIGLVGGVSGAALGALPSWYLQVHGVTLSSDVVEKMGSFPLSATFYANLTPTILAQAVLLGLIIAVAGAFIPALRAARVQPVTAMRRRR